MLNIGCHLSASDGYVAMAKQAIEIGANTFQFFTRNPRGFKAKDIDNKDDSVKQRWPIRVTDSGTIIFLIFVLWLKTSDAIETTPVGTT